MPLPLWPYLMGPPNPAITGVNAVDIQARLATALMGDTSLLSLLPAGTTIGSIIPPNALFGTPAIALEVAGESWKNRSMGGVGVGTSQMTLTLAAGVVMRLSDRTGTPATLKAQELQLETQFRRSLEAQRQDSGTPRQWVNLKPGKTVFTTTEGVRQAITFVEILCEPLTNP